MDLSITIPTHNQQEVTYTMSVLLGEYLGVNYSLTAAANEANFVFEYGANRLIIENHFFCSEDLSKLYNVDNLPTKVISEEHEIDGVLLPVTLLYGCSDLISIERGLCYKGDLVSSTFFMLSRWEESLPFARDEHGRFAANMSAAKKYGFLDRPVVNEYIEVLWQLLLLIGYDGKRKTYKYKCVPTHDVDHPFMWKSNIQKSKSIAAKLIKGRAGELKRSVQTSLEGRDPWDTFDLLMDKAEAADAKANFFFMSEGSSKLDSDYKLSDSSVLKVIENIKERGHSIGLHPSYNTVNDTALFAQEKKKLIAAIGDDVHTGRQHFLRFEVPTTWSTWEQNSMSWDSTMGYADQLGFRCGTCYPFTVFDIVERQHLDLVERPLLLMDVTVQKYMNLSPSQATAKVRSIQEQVKKYQGEFVFLWHNSSFITDEWVGYESTLQACYQ